MSVLTREFYERTPEQVGRDLIGMQLVRRTAQGVCRGTIVETEAYLAAGDSASHSYQGRTRKNATMFGRAGLLYVYPIHARYCLNAVTESRGIASAVLIRAVIPVQGIELMQQRRGSALIDIARGPARLCEAFAVDRRLDGWDLTRGVRIWIEQPDAASITDPKRTDPIIATSRRIGVTSAHDLELRFFMKDCPYVSWRRVAQ